MNYRVRALDAEVRIEIGKAVAGPAGWKRFTVRVDGEGPHEVLARFEDGLVTFQWAGRFFHARVANAPPEGLAATVEVLLRGEAIPCQVERDAPGASGAGLHRPQGRVSVKAPMPGRVVALRVRAGDRVAKGDLLLTLEAMKMQNEFSSPVAGTVIEVRTNEGAVAVTDETLVVIEPAPAPGA
jgi:glutaconyl-CoA decarboxylase